MDCMYVEHCGFHNKFKSRESLIWQEMVKQHCEDGMLCSRRVMFNSGQKSLSDDLMPAGVHASKAFLSLP